MVKRVPPVNSGWPQTPALFGLGVVAILLFIVYLATVKIVPAGNVGVVTNFGAVQKETLDPGLHFVTPFVQNVHQVNTQVQAHSFQEIDAASQELQTVKLTGKVNFAIDARHAAGVVFPPGGYRGLNRFFSQYFDWNEPPMFRSFLRLDATSETLRIRCFAASVRMPTGPRTP